jgi:hypothetical protein
MTTSQDEEAAISYDLNSLPGEISKAAEWEMVDDSCYSDIDDENSIHGEDSNRPQISPNESNSSLISDNSINSIPVINTSKSKDEESITSGITFDLSNLHQINSLNTAKATNTNDNDTTLNISSPNLKPSLTTDIESPNDAINIEANDTMDTFVDSPITCFFTPTKSPSKDHNNSLDSINRRISFSESATVHVFSPTTYDKFVDNLPVSHTDPPPSKIYRFYLFLAVFAIPFAYGASTSLMYIFFLIELMEQFHVSPITAGLFLAATYGCRVIFTSLTRWAPKCFILIGTLASITGHFLIYQSQPPPSLPSQESLLQQKTTLHDNKDFTLFIVGSLLIHCNECFGALQIFVRDVHPKKLKRIGKSLVHHLYSMKIARFGSFIVAMFLYQYNDVRKLMIYGGSMVTLQLLLLLCYYVLDIFRDRFGPLVSYHREHVPCGLDCSIYATLGRRRLFMTDMSKINRSLAKNYPCDLPQSICVFTVPLLLFAKTTSTICIWGIAAHVMDYDFELNELLLCGILAAAAFTSLFTSFVTMSTIGNKYFKQTLPPPMNIYLTVSGLTISSVVVAIPNFTAFVVGLMLHTVFNSMLSILLGEIQGSSSNPWEVRSFQTFRRIVTAATVFALPTLYHINHWFPFILGMWAPFLSTIILFVRIHIAAGEAPEDDTFDAITLRKRRESVDITSKKENSKRSERNLSYGEQIMLGKLIRGKEL